MQTDGLAKGKKRATEKKKRVGYKRRILWERKPLPSDRETNRNRKTSNSLETPDRKQVRWRRICKEAPTLRPPTRYCIPQGAFLQSPASIMIEDAGFRLCLSASCCDDMRYNAVQCSFYVKHASTRCPNQNLKLRSRFPRGLKIIYLFIYLLFTCLLKHFQVI